LKISVINNKNIYFCSTGADRSVAASMPDAREAMLNAAVDSLSAFGSTLPSLKIIFYRSQVTCNKI
jgi:hypothetical protein